MCNIICHVSTKMNSIYRTYTANKGVARNFIMEEMQPIIKTCLVLCYSSSVFLNYYTFQIFYNIHYKL